MPSPFAPMTAAIDPSTSGGLVGLVLTVMQFLGAPGAGLLVAAGGGALVARRRATPSA